MRLRYANVHIHISARFTFDYLPLQTGAVLRFVNSIFGICKCKSPEIGMKIQMCKFVKCIFRWYL